MAKTNHNQPIYWAVVVLGLAFVISNWAWYQHSKAQDITNRNQSSAWLQHQVEINKLKACIDDAITPCDLNPAGY